MVFLCSGGGPHEDITDRKRLEEQLREAQERYRLIAEYAEDIVYHYDIERDRLTFVSPSVEKVLGYSQEEFLSMDPRDHLTEDSYRQHMEQRKEEIQSGRLDTLPFERDYLHKEGYIVPMELQVSFLPAEEGKPGYAVGVARDISERKKVERKLDEERRKTVEEKEYLLRELNHRVKNNLHMVSSLVNLKDATLGDDVDLSDVRHQIEAIEKIHTALQKSERITNIGFREYVEDVLSTLFRFATSREVRLEVQIPDVPIRTKVAVPLGLIINEMATNAIKHGFSDNEEARFAVSMEEDSTQRGYVITISNSGNPFPDHVDIQNPQSLGFQLIDALVSQIQGTIELEREPSPTFTIRFSTGEA